MNVGIVGTKGGMTRVFDEAGASIPVTVIEAKPNRIVQVKTPETDAYAALQVSSGEQVARRLSKPLRGHLAGGIEGVVEEDDGVVGNRLYELRAEQASADELPVVGSAITVSQFVAGQRVDVRGTSKGKGFAGTVKRWNFSTQDNTHGNSVSHRAPGAVGQCQTPGKVFKGKKMAGHMGNKRVTVQNLEVVAVDEANDLLLIKGAVPGPAGGDVLVFPATKSHGDSGSDK